MHRCGRKGIGNLLGQSTKDMPPHETSSLQRDALIALGTLESCNRGGVCLRFQHPSCEGSPHKLSPTH